VIIGGGYWLFSGEKTGELIGGQRDEKGCLGPAGYVFSEETGSCIREWELNDDTKKAVKVVVDSIGRSYALTAIEVETLKCIGCFKIKLEKGVEREQLEVELDNWKVLEK